MIPGQHHAIVGFERLDDLVPLEVADRFLVVAGDLHHELPLLGIAILTALFINQIAANLEDGDLTGMAALLGTE